MDRRCFTTLAFVAGLLIPELSVNSVLPIFGAFVLFALWVPRLQSPAVLVTVVLALVVGVFRMEAARGTETIHPQHRVEVEGVILEPPRRWGKSLVFLFRVEIWNHQAIHPVKILVRWGGCEENLEVGDKWGVGGRIRAPERPTYPGGYDQKKWLWSQGASGVLEVHKGGPSYFISPPTGVSPHQLSYRCRAWMMKRLEAIEDDRCRSLVAGVVFGETQSLPKDLQEQFRRTGTSHLLAASGMNVALLAGLFVFGGRLLGLGAWRVAICAIPAVIGYAFLAGCSPSITRAATGTTLALIALSMGRTSRAWNTLCLTVWLLLLWDPRQLFDLGFQLSVVAVIGLVSGPEPPKKMGFLGTSLVLTMSASLATLPILWCSFGELSRTLLLANLVLGPIVEALFPIGLLLTLAPFSLLADLTQGMASLSLWAVSWLSQLADPIQLVAPGPIQWTLYGIALYFWVRAERWSLRLVALPLTLLAIGLSFQAGHKTVVPKGELWIRRVGEVHWISTHSRNVLVLNESWQERRARSMIRDLGCLVEPEIRIQEGAPLRFRWGSFRWERVAPYLPDDTYVEIRVHNDAYTLKTWNAEAF